ncbi:hypothetical protein ES707_14953 [subsurface metagenome]
MPGMPVCLRLFWDVDVDVGDRNPDPDLPARSTFTDFDLVEVL